MPTYIGENKIVDRYLGDKFLEAAYIGDEKVYDPYTEITGHLPMIFKSRAAVALKNYRIRGTSAGAGVETENLLDMADLLNAPPGAIGSMDMDAVLVLTLHPNTTYTLLSTGFGNSNASDSSDIYRSVYFNGSKRGDCVFAGRPISSISDNDGVIKIGFMKSRTNAQQYINGSAYVCLLEGDHTAAQDDIVPHGYKLPLTVKGEKTENLAPPLSEWGNGYVSSGGPIAAATEAGKERYSPVISVEPNATYQWAYEAGQFPTGMYGAWFGFGWYDRDGNFISRTDGNAEVVSAVVAPANAKYVILSFDTYGEGYNTVFIKSSTHPDHYIPHRYTSDIPIYIGDSKLGQKEYRYTDITGSVISVVTSVVTEYADYEHSTVWKCYDGCYVVLHDATLKDNIKAHFNLQSFFLSGWTTVDAYGIIYDKTGAITNAEEAKAGLVLGGDYTVKTSASVEGAAYHLNITPIDDIRIWAVGYLTATKDGVTTTFYTEPKSAKVSELEPGEDVYSEPAPIIPTAPPVPLPPVPTYKGESTLSSTETLGEVTVKGRISPSRWPLMNLIFHRYDEFYPELEGANRIAVSETFHLDVGAYILHQEVITSPEPVVVIQTEGFTGGIFPSFDGYWHVDTPGLYRFQVNKSNVLDPWNAAELETLGRTSAINKV